MTSLVTDETPADAIDLVACDEAGRHRVRTPKLPIAAHGAGDAIAALFLAHYLRSGSAAEAMSRAAASVFGILKRTAEAGATGNGADRGAGRTWSTRARAFAPNHCEGKTMRRRYFTLDVFTAQRFAGNPLAVVLDPGGLDTAAMQAVAREFNLPETVFVFPPSDPRHRARVRIFTPARELPFAGHPTVGTAVLLAHLDGGAGAREIVLAEEVGPVTCQVHPGRGGGRASFGIPKSPSGSARFGTRQALRRRSG